MAKYGPVSFATLLVDGYSLINGVISNASYLKESVTQPTRPFGGGNEEHTPTNIETATLTIGEVFLDPAIDTLHNLLSGSVTGGVARIIAMAFQGGTIGTPFTGFQGAYTQKYEVMDKRDDLVRANATYLVSGLVEEGIITQNLATFTADWDTKTGGANATDAPVDYTLDSSQTPIAITGISAANPTVVTCAKPHGLTTGQKILVSGSNSTPSLNGERTVTVTGTNTFTISLNVTGAGNTGSFVRANTVAGGAGYLQVTAYTGFTGFVNKIMHSPDDVTYAALVTFTDLGSTHTPAKERKTVTGTIDRYLSNNGDVTGTGSVTVFSGFCRY